MAPLLLVGLLVTSVAGIDVSAPAMTQEFIDEINSKQQLWRAHVSPRFVGATLGDVMDLCGTILKGEEGYNNPLQEKEDDGENAYAPASFDVRDAFPDCADVSGHVRDQSTCGSCWAFASTEAHNDRRCIATGDHTLLSTEDTTSNCGFWQCFSQGCNGGQPGQAWAWFVSHGVVTGGDYEDNGKGDSCAPYSFAPCAHHVPAGKYPACPDGEGPTPHLGSSCSEAGYGTPYKQDKHFAATSYALRGISKIQSDMVQFGSATAAFTVYADFPTYQSGVYYHVSGKALGGHAIKMIGWGAMPQDGVSTDYWLIMNSWNDSWGDGGCFKIKRGNNECGIEDEVSAGTISSGVALV